MSQKLYKILIGTKISSIESFVYSIWILIYNTGSYAHILYEKFGWLTKTEHIILFYRKYAGEKYKKHWNLVLKIYKNFFH